MDTTTAQPQLPLETPSAPLRTKSLALELGQYNVTVNVHGDAPRRGWRAAGRLRHLRFFTGLIAHQHRECRLTVPVPCCGS